MKTFKDLIIHLRSRGMSDSEILETLMTLRPSIIFSIKEDTK